MTNKQIKISVIIPVYNGEKHIASAVKSLIEQHLDSIEIIVVNDGSTDQTLKVLQSFKDIPSVIVITQPNQGVSRARNTGLQHATGKYIGFLDADDIHDAHMYSKLWAAAITNDVDVVFSNILLERDEKWILKSSGFERENPYSSSEIHQTLIPYLLKIENPTFLSVCNKIYRKSLLDNNKISFDEKISLEEDTLFNLEVMAKSKSVLFIDFAGYHHQNNPNSVTRDFLKHDVFEKAIEKYHLNYNQLLGLQIPDDQLGKYQSSRLIHSVCMLFFKCSTNRTMSRQEKFLFVQKMIAHPDVVYSSKNLDQDYLNKIGKFEKLLIWTIQNQKHQTSRLICSAISAVYSPKMSEFFRKINGKK